MQFDRRIAVENSEPGSSKLVIYNVTRVLAGLYTCTAKTAAGQDQRNITLTVECKLAILHNNIID